MPGPSDEDPAAVEIERHAERWLHPVHSGESAGSIREPLLKMHVEVEDREGEQEAQPEAIAKHLRRVAGVLVVTVGGMVMGLVTRVCCWDRLLSGPGWHLGRVCRVIWVHYMVGFSCVGVEPWWERWSWCILLSLLRSQTGAENGHNRA
jgi:hypothetical protein